MKFDVLTLFPEMFDGLKQSIIGRAVEKELIDINLVNIRDFSTNKHKKVDDRASKSLQMVTAAMNLKDAYSLEGKL